MNSKHTPGPWILHGHDNHRDSREVIMSNTGEICRVKFDDNQQANAKLIASAPCLLEALQACGEALTAALSALNAEDESGEGYPVTREQIDSAQAMRRLAIARATN